MTLLSVNNNILFCTPTIKIEVYTDETCFSNNTLDLLCETENLKFLNFLKDVNKRCKFQGPVLLQTDVKTCLFSATLSNSHEYMMQVKIIESQGIYKC